MPPALVAVVRASSELASKEEMYKHRNLLPISFSQFTMPMTNECQNGNSLKVLLFVGCINFLAAC